MICHAELAAPSECCGLLIGRGGIVQAAIPMPNIARTPRTRFEVDPASHIALRRVLRAVTPGNSIVGVYHSHPVGPAVLSPRDLADAHYDDWVHIVVGRVATRWRVRAYRIQNRRARAVKIRAT